MTDTIGNNKRIAKNTLLLYVRMFVMMFTALFTSRIVLQVLGETDYGIYNIIGGVVVLFSFLNSATIQSITFLSKSSPPRRLLPAVASTS